MLIASISNTHKNHSHHIDQSPDVNVEHTRIYAIGANALGILRSQCKGPKGETFIDTTNMSCARKIASKQTTNGFARTIASVGLYGI